MPKKRRDIVTDFKLVPVSARSARRRLLAYAAGLAILFLLGLCTGYYLSSPLANSTPSAQTQVSKLQLKLEEAEQELAVYRADKAISHKASNKVREQYRAMQGQLAELNKAVNFYKSVMDPADRKTGLHVQLLSLQSQNNQHFNYRLVLTQVGNNKWRPSLTGKVQWQIDGTQDGQSTTLSDSVFIDANSTNRFSFRYFQELTGSLTLPAGFKPTNITVTAISKGKRAYQAQQSFQWNQVEHNSGNT